MSTNTKKDSDSSLPRTPTSSSESDKGELVITTPRYRNTNVKKREKEHEEKKNTEKKATEEKINGLLPFNQSILSVVTPGLNATVSNLSSFSGTPRVRNEVEELKRQVDGSIQEIVNKQLEINRLKE